MKPVRVTITLCVIAAVVVAFFTVPLPVSRVYADGVVEIDPENVEPVPVNLLVTDAPNEKVILTDLYVRDGQRVKRGDQLARFSNRKLDADLLLAQEDVKAISGKIAQLRAEAQSPRLDDMDKSRFLDEEAKAQTELARARELQRSLEEQIKHTVVRAPRNGIVLELPKVEQIGRQWDRRQALCRIGTPVDRRVLIPVEPSNFSLLAENLERLKSGEGLATEIRVNGMGTKTWHGVVTELPSSEAATIPLALSSKADGPVPIKPSNDPEQLVPQTQQYLINVYVQESDVVIPPGTRAKVKIHCRKRSAAWWVWRSVCDTFNIGLL